MKKTYLRNFLASAILIFTFIILNACLPQEFATQELDDYLHLPNPNINNNDYYYSDNIDTNNNESNNKQQIENDNQLKDNIHENKQENDASSNIDYNLIDGKDTLLKALTSVNVRSEPNVNSQIVGSLIPNAMVAYIAEKNSAWYQTIYKGQTAYISKQYCQLVYFDKTDSLIEKIIDEAKLLLGFPYIYGAQRYHWGNGNLNRDFVMGQFDCSSLTQYAFYKGAGILLDLTTRTQIYQGHNISNKSNIKRGDLMFFTNSSRRHLTGNEHVGHVAIYLGNNYILHTASTFAIIEPISAKRWSDYITSKRFI